MSQLEFVAVWQMVQKGILTLKDLRYMKAITVEAHSSEPMVSVKTFVYFEGWDPERQQELPRSSSEPLEMHIEGDFNFLKSLEGELTGETFLFFMGGHQVAFNETETLSYLRGL